MNITSKLAVSGESNEKLPPWKYPVVPQVREQPPPSFPLLRVLGPAKVRGGLLRFGDFQILGSESKGGGLLECGSRAPGSWHRTPFFRRASRAGLLYFPMFLQLLGLKYRFFRRASRAGLLHFPMFLQLFGLKYPNFFPARFARRIASFSYSFVTF